MAQVLELQQQSSKEYSGLISFRIDGFDLHAVQGLSRVFSSTTTQKHQFFNAQTLWSNSHPYVTNGKMIVLTIWIFVSKVISLLFNRLLEKTLESPLDCKEIQQVHPKGDQSWVFIGRIDAEAETPILWPPHVKS